MKQGNGKEFCKNLILQIENYEECGFSFPTTRVSKKEILSFTKNAVKAIYKHIFAEKKELTRRERLDFIEIYFQLLQSRLLDALKPDVSTFISKDSLDTGACATAGFYLFIQLLQKGEELTEEDKDLIMYMIFSPALFVRERPIDMQRLSRMISYLTTLATLDEKKRSKLFSEIEPLYTKGFFKTLSAA